MFNQILTEMKNDTIKPKKGETPCTLPELLFPVEKVEVTDFECNSDCAFDIYGDINGAKRRLNCCSDRYELVPNAEIFPKVEEIFNKANIKFSVDYSHTNYSRFYANYTVEDPKFAYKMNGSNGDIIKFRYNFQHSYNGLTIYKGIAGFFRLVCTNGLTIPVNEMEEYNLCLSGKHTEAILHSLMSFEELLNNFTTNIQKVKSAITNKYEILGGRWISDPKARLEAVLKVSNIISVDNKNFNTVNDILKRISIEAGDSRIGTNGKVNDWLIYNGINQYLYDNSRNIASPEKRRETDSKVLEFMLK